MAHHHVNEAGKLYGKLCLITGAGRGIGRAIAEAFAKEGASLALVARSESQLKEVATSCLAKGAKQCEIRQADLTDPAVIDKLTEELLNSEGAVDVLVNNAGMISSGGSNALEGDPDAWDKMISLNLTTPMRLTRRLVPAMVEKGAGAIINIGSVAAVEPMKSAGAYAAGKWGLRGWSLSCYEQLRHKNIKVVLINPAMVRTDMVGNHPGVLPERMLKPEDIAEAAMLAFHTSPACVPAEMTLRLTLSAYAEQ